FKPLSCTSSKVMVRDQRLLTAARLPSPEQAIAEGLWPQRTSARTLPSLRSTRETVSEVWLAVRALSPTGNRARSIGLRCASIFSPQRHREHREEKTKANKKIMRMTESLRELFCLCFFSALYSLCLCGSHLLFLGKRHDDEAFRFLADGNPGDDLL